MPSHCESDTSPPHTFRNVQAAPSAPPPSGRTRSNKSRIQKMSSPEEVLFVAPGFGQLKSIQEAVNAASPGSRIVVSPGLYTRSIKVNKPGLILEAKETNGEVQLSVNSGPLLNIALTGDETCTVKGFKFIHTAEQRVPSEDDWLQQFKIRSDMNCSVWVGGGNVTLEDCQMTLGSAKTPMPSVVVSGGHLTLSYCDIKGNGDSESVGVLCVDAGLEMQSCKVYKHRSGGIKLDGGPEADVKISDCVILNNSKWGVFCNSEEGTPVLQRNRVMQNEGPGVLVMRGNKARIKENEIKYNEVGIEVLDSEPIIMKNKIRCNFGNGIVMGRYQQSCSTFISGNHLSENENGIVVKGDDCRAVIEDNPFIAHNRKSGIRLEDAAYADIRGNEVFENVWQGILLVTGTSATIERNKVSGNLRANIAFGRGTVKIAENRIFKGRCEGVFGFKPSNTKVLSNEIYENNDGILVVDGWLEIAGNSVHDNKRTGITLAGKGEANLIDNEVYKNTEVGFNVRDKVLATLSGNKGFENPIQICILSKNEKTDVRSIKRDNEWIGEIQLPLPNYCSLL